MKYSDWYILTLITNVILVDIKEYANSDNDGAQNHNGKHKSCPDLRKIQSHSVTNMQLKAPGNIASQWLLNFPLLLNSSKAITIYHTFHIA